MAEELLGKPPKTNRMRTQVGISGSEGYSFGTQRSYHAVDQCQEPRKFDESQKWLIMMRSPC